MADMLARAQIALLADLLHTNPATLSSLEHLGAEGLQALREAMSDALFDSLAAGFARVSKLAPLVPNALVVAVAQKGVPPEVAGRVGGALGLDHEDRAVGVLSGMKPAYLADAARYVDPRVIPHFAPKLPARLLIPAAKELLCRGDYLTASRFVEYATEQHIVDFEKAIDDDEGLIRTAVLVAQTGVINDILRVAGPDRLVRMATSAADGSPEFVLAMLAVLNRIEPESAAPGIDQLLGNPDAERVSRVLRIAGDDDALTDVLDLSAHLSSIRLRHLAAAPILSDAAFARQMKDFTDTAVRRRAWKRLQQATLSLASPTATIDS